MNPAPQIKPPIPHPLQLDKAFKREFESREELWSEVAPVYRDRVKALSGAPVRSALELLGRAPEAGGVTASPAGKCMDVVGPRLGIHCFNLSILKGPDHWGVHLHRSRGTRTLWLG